MAAPVIKVRTISSVTETAIQMSNGQFGRGVSIAGSGWTQVRIGLLLHWTNDAANHSPKFFVGLCSGTSNMFGDSTTTHAVGAYLDGAETWTFSASPPNYSDGAPGGFTAVKRVGSTLTSGGILTNLRRYNAGAAVPSADRDIYIVEINTGSPNYTIKALFNQSSAVDQSVSTLLSQMEQATPSIANYNTWSVSSKTVAVNEGTDGTLDTVNVYWNMSAISAEICAMAFARLA